MIALLKQSYVAICSHIIFIPTFYNSIAYILLLYETLSLHTRIKLKINFSINIKILSDVITSFTMNHSSKYFTTT